MCAMVKEEKLEHDTGEEKRVKKEVEIDRGVGECDECL